MTYSFFGTCADDHDQFFGCLKTILTQTILPKQIILVDSGNLNIEKEIQKKINNKDIFLIYIFEKISRVKSLNMAIDKSTTRYSFRFDSRSRFSKSYAENAIRLLSDKSLDLAVVGGVPKILNSSYKFQAFICAEIMRRQYIFFFPRHRNPKYSGFSSSVYLGCFRTDLLQNIRFSDNKKLLSEDSLIINEFLERGFKVFLSSNINISYVCRDSLLNIIKLFNTYGYCRINTIITSRKLFISKRHFYVFIIVSFLSFMLIKYSFLYLFFLILILFVFNLFNEIFFLRKNFKVYMPFYATLCQFSWIFGFFWGLLGILRRKKIQSNFIS